MREVAVVAHPVQQLLRADRTRRQHDVGGDERASTLAHPRAGAFGRDLVTAVRPRADRRHRGEGEDPRAAPLRQVQVVLQECVLGSVAAAGHAFAALGAAGALRADPAEVRIGGRDPRLAEVDADGSRDECLTDAHLVRDGPHHLVGRGRRRVTDDAEHASGLVVVGRQLGAPVGDATPLGVVVEGRQRFVQRVGVDERPAPDAGAGEDHRVFQERDPLDAEQPELGCPEEGAQPPGGLRQRRFVEAPPRLEDDDPIALLGETQRRGAAAKAAPDDDDVARLGAHPGDSRRRSAEGAKAPA